MTSDADEHIQVLELLREAHMGSVLENSNISESSYNRQCW